MDWQIDYARAMMKSEEEKEKEESPFLAATKLPLKKKKPMTQSTRELIQQRTAAKKEREAEAMRLRNEKVARENKRAEDRKDDEERLLKDSYPDSPFCIMAVKIIRMWGFHGCRIVSYLNGVQLASVIKSRVDKWKKESNHEEVRSAFKVIYGELAGCLINGSAVEEILYPVVCNDLSGLINKCIEEAERRLEKDLVNGCACEDKALQEKLRAEYKINYMSIIHSDQVVKAKHLHKELLESLKNIQFAIRDQ